jgi:hypothetical protein
MVTFLTFTSAHSPEPEPDKKEWKVFYTFKMVNELVLKWAY